MADSRLVSIVVRRVVFGLDVGIIEEIVVEGAIVVLLDAFTVALEALVFFFRTTFLV